MEKTQVHAAGLAFNLVAAKAWLASLAFIPVVSASVFLTVLSIRVSGLFVEGTNADTWWKLALTLSPWFFSVVFLSVAGERLRRDDRSLGIAIRVAEARNVWILTLAIWTLGWTFGSAVLRGYAWIIFTPFAFGLFPLLALPLLLPRRAVFRRLALVAIVLGSIASFAWLSFEISSPPWNPSPSAFWLQALAAALGVAAEGTAAAALLLRVARPNLGRDARIPMMPSAD